METIPTRTPLPPKQVVIYAEDGEKFYQINLNGPLFNPLRHGTRPSQEIAR